MPITKTETSSTSITLIAGANISAGKLIMMISGLAYYFDASVASNFFRIIGFSSTAATTGNSVTIVVGGPISISGLIQDDIYYADPTTPGDITITQPTGTYAIVGEAQDANTLMIDINVYQGGSSSMFAVATGTDSYVATFTGLLSLSAGQSLRIQCTNANTGASTLQVNAFGTFNIYKYVTSPLELGDIKAGQMLDLLFDGTNLQLTSVWGNVAQSN